VAGTREFKHNTDLCAFGETEREEGHAEHEFTMRYRDNREFRYRLANPPKALLKARLDNIAIVPASMLPLTQTLKEKVNTLPKGGVFLCYAKENSRQRKILERVEETFREQGHMVKSMSVGEVYKTNPNF
jgi:hypothetical protein